MQETVTDTCLVDVAGLGVRNLEMMIATVPIGICDELIVQPQNILHLHQISFKFLHISSFPLPFHELQPRFKQILNRDDILVGKTP